MLKARDTWPSGLPNLLPPVRRGLARRCGDPRTDPRFLHTPPRARDRLVLDRARLARSQFVFIEVRGRPAILWQTHRAARAADPGARIPQARAIPC